MGTAEKRVFISYASHDVDSATLLEQGASASGYRAWRDQTRLVGELDWSRGVAEALVQSDAVCLLWSDAASRSTWVRHEYLVARALRKVIVPCLLPGAPALPEPLSNSQGVVWSSPSDGVTRTVTHLGHLSTWLATYDYTMRPPRFRVPFNPNPVFTGRSTDLVELYLNVIGTLNKVGITHVGVVGMGGIGKTQLAVEFVWRFAFAFDAVFWIQAAESEQWLAQFIDLARDQLGLTIADGASANMNAQCLQSLREYCDAHPQTLIVLDNVESPDLLNSERPFFGIGFTALSLGCNLLFTTRRRFDLPAVRQQSVGVLSGAAALELLTESRPARGPREQEQAVAICNALGYLPLAIVLAAGFLKKRKSISFRDYYEVLRNNRLETLDLNQLSETELATRHRTAVTATLNEQWNHLGDENARRLFQLVALFPVGSIVPNARLGVLAGFGPSASPIVRPADEAILMLCELNLLDGVEDGTAVRIHPLLRDFARGLKTNDELEQFQEGAAQNVANAYTDPFRLEREYLDRGVEQIIEDLRIGEVWANEGAAWIDETRLLRRLLDRERQNLRATADSSPSATRLFQQLHFRAMRSGTTALADRFLNAASRRGDQLLILRSASRVDDAALIRRLAVTSHRPDTVTVSADGVRALSNSSESAILWNVESGQPLRTFLGEHGQIQTSCLSRDGRWALIASGAAITHWDVETEQPVRTLTVHSNPVTTIAVANDASHALFGFDDSTIEVWDIEHGRLLRTIRGHSGKIESLAVTSDGRLAASGSFDTTITIWNLATGDAVTVLRGHTQCVNAIAISDDGTSAISASYDNTLIVWDVSRQRAIRTLEGHSRSAAPLEVYTSINAVSLSADGRRAISGAHDQNVIVWDVDLGVPIRICRGHSNRVTTVALTKDGRTALSGSWDGTILMWDVGSAAGALAAVTPSAPITCVSLTLDGRRAFTSSADGTLTVWDAEKANAILEWRPSTDHVHTVALSHDGRIGISGSRDGVIWLWDFGGRGGNAYRAHSSVISVTVSADGQRALTGSTDATLSLWDGYSGELLVTFETPASWVLSVSMDAGGRRALSGHYDGAVRVWDLVDNKLLHELRGHSKSATSVSMSHDGRCGLSASEDVVILWDLDDPHAKRTLGPVAAPTWSVALTSGRTRAITASKEGFLTLWDLESGRIVTSLATSEKYARFATAAS